MKSKRLLIVIACLLVLAVSGWRITEHFKSQKAAPEGRPNPAAGGSNVVFSIADVPALGLGNLEDRKWIEYYYRHRELQNATGVLQRIAASAKDNEDSETTAHFFATIFRAEPARIKEVEAEAAKAHGAARAFLQKVATDVATNGISRLKDRKDLRRVWAEYLATGDVAKIDTILSAFDDLESGQTTALQSNICQLFFNVVPFHADVYYAVLEAARLADGTRQEKVQNLVDDLREKFDDPVNDPLTRAANFAHQGDYTNARALIKTAQGIFPDSARAQITIADVAEAEGKLQEARFAASRAVAMYPTLARYRYNLGRICFLLGDYKAAARSYEKAIELGYSSHAVWHAVARAYQESGNREDAIRCFKKYLQLEPHGPNELLVKQYLASVNQPVEEDPKDIVSMLHRGDYSVLEDRLSAILKEKKRNKYGASEISAAYEYLCSNPGGRFEFEKFKARFERWVAQRPKSHFAHAAYGNILIDEAWQARGGGWANTVTPEGWRLFEERLKKAREELEYAYELDPSDPIPPAHLITVAKGLSLDRSEMEKQFQRGIAVSPDECLLYEKKLGYLMPKWAGTEEEMFDFAREVATNSPPDSLAPLILVQAHWEIFNRSNKDRRYFQQPEVWNEMKGVYSRLCDKFPEAKERRNWFALTAFYAEDYETAARQLQIIGEDWIPSVWGSRSFFDRVRAKTEKKLKH